MNLASWISASQLILQILVVPSAHGSTDPSTKWMTLKTAHFDLIYDSAQYKQALRFAEYAETAFTDLVPIFKEYPKKTVIWLNNTTDISNGMATAFPYPAITILPVTPTSAQSVGEYGHWGQELLTHEYTHILQFEPQHGLMGMLRWIFGSIVVPNGVLPRWWLEGMAVETESQLSNGGRLRSIQQQAVLRALASDHRLEAEDISRINEVVIPDWMGGGRPYLYGSLMWKELVDLKGNYAIYNLNQRYSSRIPFIINAPVEDLTGKNYQQHLDNVYLKINKSTQAQIKTIQEQGLMKKAVNPGEGATQSSPVISPNGRHLAYFERPSEGGARLVIKSRDDERTFREKEPVIYSQVAPGNRIYWSPDSKSIYFDKVDTYKRYYSFSDIHRFDLETKSVSPISVGLRAREAAVSPDGKHLAFIKIDGDQLHLAQSKIDGSEYKILYSPPPGYRVSHPEFFNHSILLFTERNLANQEELKGLQLSNGNIKTFLSDYQPIYNPRSTALGLLFVSDKTGVPNIYLAQKNFTSAIALSNFETSAEIADWDAATQELVYSYLSPDGPMIAFTTQPKGKIKKFEPPQISLTAPYKRKPYHFNEIKTKEAITEPLAEEYSPWGYLLPRYWLPYVALSQQGLFIQASTSANDPLDKHAYSVIGAFDTGTDKFNWAAGYTNHSTRVTLSLGASDIYDFFGGTSIVRRETTYLANLASYIWGLGAKWSWVGSWEYQNTETSSTSVVRQGPGLGIRFINVAKQGKQLVPESGGDALLTATYFIEELGDIGFFRTQLNASKYFSGWILPEHHVISAKIRGLYAPDNNLLITGASTASGSYENSLISNQLLMRGYLTGNFIAQNAANASLEYVFPLKYSYSGWGTFPLFSRNWHGRIVADAITMDGVFFDQDANVFRGTDFGEFFYGGGGEIHWQTTIGYHMPFRAFFGLYYGANDRASGGVQTFVGFGL